MAPDPVTPPATDEKCPRCEGAGKYQRFPNSPASSCSLCIGTGLMSEAVKEPVNELASLRSRLAAAEVALTRIIRPTVDQQSLRGLKIEYRESDNRFYVYAEDGSFRWSGEATFNAWQCVTLADDRAKAWSDLAAAVQRADSAEAALAELRRVSGDDGKLIRSFHRMVCTKDNCRLDGGPEHAEAFPAFPTGRSVVETIQMRTA